MSKTPPSNLLHLQSSLSKSDEKPTPERLTIDDMLVKYCGEFGPWHIKQFLLINLSWIIDAFHTMVIIFADREPDWRCLNGSSCQTAAKNICGLEPGSWEWVDRGSSTVSEWGLICGEKYKVGLAQALFFFGCLIGDAIYGPMTDSSFGRKRSLALVCLLNTIFGCLTAFSPSYWIYVLIRFLTGVNISGNGLCAFVLSTEPVGPSKRGLIGMSSFYFFSTGIAVLAAIAYIFQSWRKLYIVSSIPSLIYLITILPFVSESPRWYLVRGKIDEAMNAMKSIAEFNGKHIPEGVTLALDHELHENQYFDDEALPLAQQPKNGRSSSNKETSSLVSVIRSPIIRVRVLLASAMSLMCGIMYYGLSLNAMNLETNLYVSVVLNAIVEIPSLVVTTGMMNKLGRKWVGMWTFWLSGFICLIGSCMKNGGKWMKMVKTICGVMAMFGMSGNASMLYIYYSELFPTEVRNTAVGLATQASEVGAIMAPFLVICGNGFAFVMFGVCGILGGIVVFYMPETINEPFYDTIVGMERGTETPPHHSHSHSHSGQKKEKKMKYAEEQK